MRRVRRQNGERREGLLQALRRRFGDRVAIEGGAAGLHVVAWFRDLPEAAAGALIAAARACGVGVHPVAPLYDPDLPEGRPDRLGLILGYAALDGRRIERGVRLLGEAFDGLAARP